MNFRFKGFNVLDILNWVLERPRKTKCIACAKVVIFIYQILNLRLAPPIIDLTAYFLDGYISTSKLLKACSAITGLGPISTYTANYDGKNIVSYEI